MDSFNYVIVGSGPSGVSAGMQLEGKGACIVDVGVSEKVNFAYSSLDEALKSGNIESILGPSWEMLSNITMPDKIHPKLRFPGVNYIQSGQSFRVLDEFGDICFRGAGSFAAGGFSNAWGSQLLRYNNNDLIEAGDWPIKIDILEAYYRSLEAHIGISGEIDDMYNFFGETRNMLPPIPIVPAADFILNRYTQSSRNSNSFLLGKPRLALLTKKYRGYSAYNFTETEFFSTNQPGSYTARRSLEELCSRGKISYFGGQELVAYREFSEFIEIDLRHKKSNATQTFRTKHLLLACGTCQTARIVLLNKKAALKSLPFIDQPPTLIPFFIPRMFGSPIPTRTFPIQLTASITDNYQRDMISFYYPGGLLWSDLLADMPLPINSALKLLPHILGGLLIAQIWETSKPLSKNRLSLDSKGSIVINYPERPPYLRLNKLLRALRPFGMYTFQKFAKTCPPGSGFHYVGCLPMRNKPKDFETHIDGRLYGSMRLRIIDGSVLPSIPAKNHSLTMMANAARIADETIRCGY